MTTSVSVENDISDANKKLKSSNQIPINQSFAYMSSINGDYFLCIKCYQC